MSLPAMSRIQLLRNWLTNHRPRLSIESVTLLSCIWFSLFCNHAFWRVALHVHPDGVIWPISLFCILLAANASLLSLLLWQWNSKVLLSVLFITTALVVHFIDAFGIYINVDMIQNVLHTDSKESHELISLALLKPMALYALVPIVFIWWNIFPQRSVLKTWLLKVCFFAGTLFLGIIGAALSSNNFATLARNHREVRFLATPFNFITALTKAIKTDVPRAEQPRIPIGQDAVATPHPPGSRPTLFVIVVGETARAKNWGLDNYTRQTTPLLAHTDGVINFSDAHSCGTNTEISVPCMFSPYGRHDYNQNQIRAHQSLLHVLEYAHITTLWRDNQSGCKGVCDGLPLQRLDNLTVKPLCANGRCYDAILLDDFARQVRAKPGDRVIVLHQLGSHGPNYFERYPPAFQHFTPTCDTGDFGNCGNQALVNSYDNTLYYTDYFLSQVIATLKTMTDYNTLMFYASDHGESLGENGIYLHGMPYAIAPKEQTSIPMLFWFSPQFIKARGIDIACVQQRAKQYIDHDTLFPTVLSLMQVKTSLYDPKYDALARCYTAPFDAAPKDQTKH